MNSSTESARIVVGVDGSPSSAAALRKAAELAGALQTGLLIITSWTVPNFYSGYTDLDGTAFELDAKDRQAASLGEAFDGRCPVPMQTSIRYGRAAEELIKASADADLLVVGTRGHSEFVTMILGSVSLECIAHAACPVLTTRAKTGTHHR